MASMPEVRILPPEISSPYGRVHNIPFINTKKLVFFSDKSINFNTACANHVVAGIPKKKD